MGFMNPPYATGIAGGTEFPPSPNERDCFYRTDLNEFYIYDGTAWIPWRTRGSTIVVAASNSLDPTLADPAYRCDGTADQAEINAAIAALPAAGGSVVLLEGTYTIAAAILINRDDVMLVGSGHGTLIQVSANAHMIEVGGGATNVIIKDLQVDGSAATGAPNNGIFFHGTAANPITHSRVEGCYVHGNYRYGINLSYSEDCMVVRNRVESTRSDASGILIYLSRRNQVALNDCDDCNGAGIRVYLSEMVDHIRSERNIIANNRCSSSLDGIELELSSYNIVVGNYCEDNTVNGIELQHSYRNMVVGNYCEHNGTGIEVCETSTYNMVDGNYCENNGTGIEISEAASKENYVVDNYLRNNTTPLTDNGKDTKLPEIFVPVIDPDTNLGTHPAVNLPDAVDTTVRFQILIPMEFTELVRAQIVVVQTATAGSPNMQWSTATNFGKICSDEDYNTHSDAETDQTTAITQNDLECIDVSGSLDGIAAGDLVGFEFIRRASQLGDTIDAAAYLLGFRMQYVQG